MTADSHPPMNPSIAHASDNELAGVAMLTLLLFIIYEIIQTLIALFYFLNLAVTYNTKSPNASTYLAWLSILLMAWFVTLLTALQRRRIIKSNTPISARKFIAPTGITLAIAYTIKTGFLIYFVLST